MRIVRILLLMLVVGFVTNAFGQSSSELKRRKEALSREIEMLNSSLKKTSSSKRLSLKQINMLTAQIRLREEKINTMNSEIRLLDNQISDNTNTVHSLQSQLDKLKKDYAGMVLFAFRNQSSYSKLMFIFASRDFNQAYKRLKYLQQFGEYRQKQAKYIQETSNDLHIKIVELDHNKQEKSGLLSDQEKEKKTLGGEKENQSKVLSSLSKQEKELKTELSQKQKESARLARAINAAIAREIELARRKAEEEARKRAEEEARRVAAANAAAAEKARANNTTPPPPVVVAKPVAKPANVLSSTPEAAKLSSDFLSNRGRLPWPVAEGTIVEGFGSHSYGVNVKLDNNGIDIKTSEGASVRAVFSGDVSAVQDLGGSLVVIIRHGEYFTVYSNLRSASVSKGQKVNVKQNIGSVLTDPTDGTTQVHFEVRKGADPMNPTGWLAN